MIWFSHNDRLGKLLVSENRWASRRYRAGPAHPTLAEVDMAQFSKLEEQREIKMAALLRNPNFDDEVGRAINALKKKQGNTDALYLQLEACASNLMLRAWFIDHDLVKAKVWGYTSAKNTAMSWSVGNIRYFHRGRALSLLPGLISDSDEVINELDIASRRFDASSTDDPRTQYFWTMQIFLALRGEWELISQRCDLFDKTPPKAAYEKKYLKDNLFFRALALGDVPKMEETLAEIASPKSLQGRLNEAQTGEWGFLSTSGTIFAKIAWRHGYKVKVNSPYVPKEWLPVQPLPKYENFYSVE